MTDSGTDSGTDSRSKALAGRERIPLHRPEWAASRLSADRRPLPLISVDALRHPDTGITQERLIGLHRERHGGGWSPQMAELRERGSAIRRETLGDLDGHLRRLTERVTANGGVVHRAASADEAVAIVTGIAEAHGARLVVKSKSMATEEIHLNDHLQERGIDVVETDLGEYIVQLADERPSHIVAPAVHKSRADVVDLFSSLAGEPVPESPDELAAFARARLREDFHRADVGITGVNFAAADTGTLTIVTNEGNARMATSQPRVHIAVMTVEKVIPRFADLAVLLPLLTYAATRQGLSSYQTMITGPRRPGELDGPDELHLVIVDNGRTKLLGGRYEEVLACIRCGACQVACPVYRVLGGGHAYSAVYSGPIGAVLTPLLGDRSEGRDLPFLSSLCGNCYDVCPVKIPLPDMLVDLRADYEAGAAHREVPHAGWRAWSWGWRSRPGFAASTALARASSRLVAVPAVARRLPGARRWAAGRALPDLRQAGGFRRWFAKHSSGGAR